MLFDANQAIQDADPWDLQIQVGENVYTVRPLTVADVLGIRSLTGAAPAVHERALSNLFQEKPDTSKWTETQAANVLGAVWGYLRARAEKNFQAIVDRAATIARQTPTTRTGRGISTT